MASSLGETARPDLVATDAYARRFGALLRRQRRRRALSARRLSVRSARIFSAATLRAHERGERVLDPETVQRLCAVYGIPLETVASEHRRVVIDLDRRELRLGGETFELPDTDHPGPHLQEYVRIVNRLRSRPMRSPATVRHDDTEALAEALEIDADEVVTLLADVIGQEAGARGRVLALRTGSGTLAAVVVIGAATTALVSRDAESQTVVLSATSLPAAAEVEDADDESAVQVEDDEVGNEEADDEAAGEVAAAPVAVPPSATVAGPDLHPSMAAAARPAGGGSEPEFEDETNIDAPGGPVTIERDPPEGENETNVHASGEHPIEMTREDYEQGSEARD